jgi:hypothetical protein
MYIRQTPARAKMRTGRSEGGPQTGKQERDPSGSGLTRGNIWHGDPKRKRLKRERERVERPKR